MILSSAGLGLAVFAILRSSVWGFVQPRAAPTINGTEITPLGFSVVPFMVLAGLALLWAFVAWERRRAGLGRDVLLDTALLRISQLRAGLSTLVGQQLVLMGTFFVIPVYLQVVLGFDAFETGKRLLPLSLAMLVFALLGPRIAGRRSPRTVAQIGLVGVSIGALVMLGTLDVTLNDPGFKIALGLVGAGAGLLASQLGNVIMSAVAPTQTSEAGGLQGTAQNLGSSLGTAIIGAVLIAALATGFSERISDNPEVPAGRAGDDRREHRAGNRHRARRRTSRQAAVEGGLTPGPGPRGRRRLRRGATRRAAALTRRRGARGAAVATVYPALADSRANGNRCRRRGAAGGRSGLGRPPIAEQISPHLLTRPGLLSRRSVDQGLEADQEGTDESDSGCLDQAPSVPTLGETGGPEAVEGSEGQAGPLGDRERSLDLHGSRDGQREDRRRGSHSQRPPRLRPLVISRTCARSTRCRLRTSAPRMSL